MRTHRLNSLSPSILRRLKESQREAARVWNLCMQTHKEARMTRARWPNATDLYHRTRGQFALNAQVVQQIVRAFLGTIETTRKLRKEHPEMRMKYPWRSKQFYPVKWPAQAVHREKGRVILPMGKGRSSLILPLDFPDNAGACTSSGTGASSCMSISKFRKRNRLPARCRRP